MPKQTAIHSMINIYISQYELNYLLYFIIVTVSVLICNVFNVAPVMLYITTGHTYIYIYEYILLGIVINSWGICCMTTVV